MSRSEERSLANILQLVELNITSSYSRLLSDKFEAVQERKQQLRQEAVRLQLFMTQSKHVTEAECSELVQQLNATAADSIEFQVYDANGQALPALERTAVMPSLTNVEDVKNRNLAKLAHPDELSARGEFVVFTPPQGITKQKMLGYFLPYPEKGWTIATFTPLSDIESASARNITKLTKSLDKAFNNMKVFNTGFIALFDANLTVHVNTGKRMISSTLMEQIIDAVQRGEKTLTTNDPEKGTIEHRFFHFRPLRWYVLVSAPVSEILQPANDLVGRQLRLIIGVFIACLVLALMLAERVIRPIQTLTDFAQHLPEKDFSAQDEEDHALAQLPTHRRDEVGDLARSFDFMCRELSTNIKNLMETTASKERIQGELNVAREIQEGILPKMFPAFPERQEFTLYAYLESAKEVGGDLYDFFFLDDDHICLVLGDVSDKGVPAALFMAVTVTMVRSTMQEGLPVHEAMEKINDALSRDNPKSMFVTLFIGVLNIRTGELDYANGGHNPPVVVHNGVAVEVHGVSGLVVGGMENIPYAPLQLKLEQGDTLFLYTDGITEAMNERQELFSSERLFELLGKSSDCPVEDVLVTVREQVSDFSGDAPQSDDITMMLLRYHGAEKDEENVIDLDSTALQTEKTAPAGQTAQPKQENHEKQTDTVSQNSQADKADQNIETGAE